MKKQYIKPDTFVVEIKQKYNILAGSDPYSKAVTDDILNDIILDDEGIEEKDLIIR